MNDLPESCSQFCLSPPAWAPLKRWADILSRTNLRLFSFIKLLCLWVDRSNPLRPFQVFPPFTDFGTWVSKTKKVGWFLWMKIHYQAVWGNIKPPRAVSSPMPVNRPTSIPESDSTRRHTTCCQALIVDSPGLSPAYSFTSFPIRLLHWRIE